MLRSVKASIRRAPSPSVQRALLSRAYTAPTSPAQKPALAVQEAQPDFEPSIMVGRPQEPEPHRYNRGPIFRNSNLILPNPLPSDVVPPSGSLQSQLYKPTSAVDTIAMLSICSSRPEFVPRAYQIFAQLLDDAKAGKANYPEASVWANVVRGIAKLTKEKAPRPGQKDLAALWRGRVSQLVWEWEKLHDNAVGNPCTDDDGILIYRAWFSGVVR